jgi:DNA-binding transcriptional ArsR family regulator
MQDSLERLFHEPNRLAVLSHLAAAPQGLTFPALRDACGLTDGNLNRHLKALEESGAVACEKRFVKLKPQTTIRLTPAGLARFSDYLAALEQALKQAQRALKPHKGSGFRARGSGLLLPQGAHLAQGG